MRHLQYPRRELTDMEVGWLAGLFEGEGTAYIHQSQRGPNRAISTSVRVCICMTDRDVIERLQNTFPSPTMIAERKRRVDHKRQYEWRLSQRDDISKFLRLILPVLGQRRTEQALRVLSYAEDPNGGLGSGHRNKTHCPNGHAYTPENTRSNSGKRSLRRCKACERAWRQRKAARQKAVAGITGQTALSIAP